MPRPVAGLRRAGMAGAVFSLLALLASGASYAQREPWTHQEFADRPEDFTFAVISDLTGAERPGIFDVAVEDLNLLRPAFVMSVGDLIDGYVNDEKEVVRQWEHFDARAKKLFPPFFYVVGNHDITNTMMRRVWEQRLGRRYYHFIYKNVLFLALDSEDFAPSRLDEIFEKYDYVIQQEKKGNDAPMQALKASFDWEGTTRGAISAEQVAYFKRMIAENPNVRWTFLFLHRPLWQGDGNESLREIEAALGERPYTVFAGHSHSYRYFEAGKQIHIRLGTTGGGWKHYPNNKGNFDHVMLVTMTRDGPSIANLRLDGILNEKGQIPAGGDELCFSDLSCARKREETSKR